MPKKSSQPVSKNKAQAETLKLLEIKCDIVKHLLRIPNAAKVAGMTVNGLRKAVRQGLIGVYRIDDELFVHRHDVINYQPTSPSGRPRSRQSHE